MVTLVLLTTHVYMGDCWPILYQSTSRRWSLDSWGATEQARPTLCPATPDTGAKSPPDIVIIL